MSDLSFVFNTRRVRVILDEAGEPWFVAKDVCEVLGTGLPANHLRNYPDCEKGVCSVPTPGGRQEVLTVSEGGLYRMVVRSRKPSAEQFQAWVFNKALPEIRRTGSYQGPPQAEDVSSPPAAPALDPLAVEMDDDMRDWLAMVREARISYGRKAAQRLWARSPLPAVSTTPPDKSDLGRAIREFLDKQCVITGSSADFVSLGDLTRAYGKWAISTHREVPAGRGFNRALAALAVAYVHPETLEVIRPHKRSHHGYVGLRLRKASAAA